MTDFTDPGYYPEPGTGYYPEPGTDYYPDLSTDYYPDLSTDYYPDLSTDYYPDPGTGYYPDTINTPSYWDDPGYVPAWAAQGDADIGQHWYDHPIDAAIGVGKDYILDPLEKLGTWIEKHPGAVALGNATIAGLSAIPANRRKQQYQDELMRRMNEDRALKLAKQARNDISLGQIMANQAPPRRRVEAPVHNASTYGRTGSGVTERDVPVFAGNAAAIPYAEGGHVGGCPRCGALTAYARGRSSGQADTVPARLSHGEYVMDADTVASLGDGNNEAGAKRLDQMRVGLRKHKHSKPATSIPPPSKNPMAYMKGAK